jgi:hypothetical protein
MSTPSPRIHQSAIDEHHILRNLATSHYVITME